MVAYNLQFWQEKAKSLTFNNQLFINGKFVDSTANSCFDCINPATKEVLTSIAAAQEQDIDLAVQAARKAFDKGDWSQAAPQDRKVVLLKLAELIQQNTQEFALLETLDMGKPITSALTVDIPGAAHFWQWYGEAIDKIYDEIAPTSHGDLALVRRTPLGVIGAVVPWNFPLDMATWKCAPALALGNSVVLKPAEQSPLSALKLAELAKKAGLPDGVLNVVPGMGEIAGRALGMHHDVDCLTFTGSTEVGKLFMCYSGQSNMKQVWLECGGKSPNLVFSDCEDLDAAAINAAAGIFFNQGEICSANSRLLVERSIKDCFLEKVTKHAQEYYPGDPLDPKTTMGALVEDRHTKRVCAFIEDGKKSATLHYGGNQKIINGSDNFVEPTIFDNVDNTQRIAREEIFGPVLSVIPFDHEDEALAIANDTQYGLAASLWSNNLSRVHRLSSQLHAGTVSVNAMDALSAVTPFGGFKQSGTGRDLSLHALDKFSALKTVWIKY